MQHARDLQLLGRVAAEIESSAKKQTQAKSARGLIPLGSFAQLTTLAADFAIVFHLIYLYTHLIHVNVTQAPCAKSILVVFPASFVNLAASQLEILDFNGFRLL